MFDLTFIDKYGTTVTNLTQWDMNQKIYIESNSFDNKAPQFHFCNKNSEKALVVQSKIEGDLLEITVPNVLLIEPYPITVYAYLMDIDNSVESGKTIEYTTIPVRQRPEPSDFTYEENTDIVDVQDIVAEIVAYNQQIKLEEKARVEAEALRVEAENQRQTNEEQRQLAIQNAETATIRANEAAEVCEDLIENLGGNAEIVHSSEKGAANGVATLDENGKLLMEQVPEDLKFELPEEIDATTLNGYSADDFMKNNTKGFISNPLSGSLDTNTLSSKYGMLQIKLPYLLNFNSFSFHLSIDTTSSSSSQRKGDYIVSGVVSGTNFYNMRVSQSTDVSNVETPSYYKNLKFYFGSKYNSEISMNEPIIGIGNLDDNTSLNISWYDQNITIYNLIYNCSVTQDEQQKKELYDKWNENIKIDFTGSDYSHFNYATCIQPKTLEETEGFLHVPKGGIISEDSSEYGLLKIKIPSLIHWTNLSFNVNISNSQLGGIEYHIHSFCKVESYIVNWGNASAVAIPANNSTFPILPVYFTKDINGNLVVFIGDKDNTTFEWSWGNNITINNVCFNGHVTEELNKNWEITITNSSSDIELINSASFVIENPSIVINDGNNTGGSETESGSIVYKEVFVSSGLCPIIQLPFEFLTITTTDGETIQVSNDINTSFKMVLENGAQYVEINISGHLNGQYGWYDNNAVMIVSRNFKNPNLSFRYITTEIDESDFENYSDVSTNISSVTKMSPVILLWQEHWNGSGDYSYPDISYFCLSISDLNYYYMNHYINDNTDTYTSFMNKRINNWIVNCVEPEELSNYTIISRPYYSGGELTLKPIGYEAETTNSIKGVEAQEYVWNIASQVSPSIYRKVYLEQSGWNRICKIYYANRLFPFKCHIFNEHFNEDNSNINNNEDGFDIVIRCVSNGEENCKLIIDSSDQNKSFIDKVRITNDGDCSYLEVNRSTDFGFYIKYEMMNRETGYYSCQWDWEVDENGEWMSESTAPSETATILVECDIPNNVLPLTSTNSTPVSVSNVAPDTNYLWVDITDMSAIKLKVYNSETSAWIAIN